MDGFETPVQSSGPAPAVSTPSDFSMESVSNTNEAPISGVIVEDISPKENFDPAQTIMEIPGTAHDKLEALAGMEDEAPEEVVDVESEIEQQAQEEQDKPEEDKEIGKGQSVDFQENEPTIEQKIMLLQAEAINMLLKSKNKEKVKDKEKEDLLKKLQNLLEETQGHGGDNKAGLVGMILNIMLALLSVGQEAIKTAQKTVEENA